MPRLTIDSRSVDVPPGSTLLDAARSLGIDVPTLCYLEGCEPSTSCLVCVVRVKGRNGFVPSCATAAQDGMEVQSETPEVRQVRKTALELLLSDHVGDCLAPCYFTCPAHMDIPLMLRQIGGENLREAIATVKEAIALPAVLGRICPGPCEKGCRRGAADGAVAVCQLKRFAADADLASASPYLPDCEPPSGKRVAVVGAGPTGLSAAYYLRRQGHAVTIFDDQPQPGGRLLRETAPEELPRDVLAAEAGLILRLGVELRAGVRVTVGSGQSAVGSGKSTVGSGQSAVGRGQEDHSVSTAYCPLPTANSSLPTAYCLLPTDFDAVLLACGTVAKDQVERWGLKPAAHGILVDKKTFQTSLPSVFAAGNAIRAKGLVVRSVADGREAAAAIHEHLQPARRSGTPVPDEQHPIDNPIGDGPSATPTASGTGCLTYASGSVATSFSTRIGKLDAAEVAGLVTIAAPAPRRDADPARGFVLLDAVQQAGRCLHCDCRALTTCKLRRYAALYGAEPNRFRGQTAGAGRRPLRQLVQPSGVLYEPGKCIDCGLCIQIVEAAKGPLGLTFVGRGFDVRVGVPFDRSLEEALGRVAAECIAACPTAALAWREDEG